MKAVDVGQEAHDGRPSLKDCTLDLDVRLDFGDLKFRGKEAVFDVKAKVGSLDVAQDLWKFFHGNAQEIARELSVKPQDLITAREECYPKFTDLSLLSVLVGHKGWRTGMNLMILDVLEEHNSATNEPRVDLGATYSQSKNLMWGSHNKNLELKPGESFSVSDIHLGW